MYASISTTLMSIYSNLVGTPNWHCAIFVIVVGSTFLRKAAVPLLLLPLLVFAFSGSLEFAHPIEEPSPVDVHTHTASAVDTDLVCAGEDPHENHNCLHVQQFNPALKLISALGNSPVFRPPTAGAIDNIRLFAVGIPPLRGPPLS